MGPARLHTGITTLADYVTEKDRQESLQQKMHSNTYENYFIDTVEKFVGNSRECADCPVSDQFCTTPD